MCGAGVLTVSTKEITDLEPGGFYTSTNEQDDDRPIVYNGWM